ncbi:NAD(P)H dehydrogenase (quinone) [Pedobacter westerhofensis]|uniref:NAD(P)H dehydrogenase (Quinone) n=1 Tax=Pedobacter westerhofensis TaxID=425512 RepID=A0A521FM58_9SPHI|nr:NmrA family NAD(P)-binding protein [Pedobacter westerhofensis]SMO97273.1 NAD(P)H dehydrogenase (quinone) [Pedobacter westerhofensis]
MILITGSTGALGAETIKALLRIIPSEQIVALARNPEKAQELVDAGITVRQGDYSDYNSLLAAFAGIDKLLMISSPAFSDQSFEANTILAAKNAGIKYVLYTGIQGKKESGWVIPGVTEREVNMEKLLAASGLSYTIALNALYIDVIPFLLGPGVIEKGVLFPSGDGAAAVASRSDLGEALAKIITADHKYPLQVTLANSQSWSRQDIARILSEITGKDIPVVDLPVDEYVAY